MRNLMKLIAVTVMTAMLLCVVIACGSADEQIYTSPSFHLPMDLLTEWLEAQPEEPTEEEEPQATPEVEETPEVPEGNSGETSGNNEKPQRVVKIYSSQGEVVTEGEIITMTSVLVGFDDIDSSRISYQWQVDRGDGAGWVDVEGSGAKKYKFKFVASKETIQYSWRLIVNIDE